MTKRATIFLALILTLCGSAAFAQDEQAAPRRGGRQAQTNPHIVSPSATPNLQPPNAPQLPYHFVDGPVAPNGEKFGNVSGVALTAQGHLLTFNRNPAIMMNEYDQNGKFLRTFNPNIAINTHGMRIDRHGNIWVLDSYLNVIWKLNPKGEPIMTMGTRGEVAAWDDTKWNHMFNQPLDVAFDKDDNIYVVQSHGGTSAPPDCTYCGTYSKNQGSVPQGSDPRILKFDKDGNYITSRALPHADGTYPTIHTVIVTPKGEVWLSDRQLHKIIVLDQSLQPLREIQEPALVSGLTVDAKGQIWLSAGMDGMIMKLDENGAVQGWIGKAGRTTDPSSNLIGEAHYLTVTPDEKTIYVADSVNGKIHKLVHN